MSDEPAAPSNPPSQSNNGRNNRGGYRPNRRRYYHSNNQPAKKADDADEPKPKVEGEPGGQPNPDSRGQNRAQGKPGRKDRALPDRDRGPRRTETTGGQREGAPPAGQTVSRDNPSREPSQPAGQENGARRSDPRRRGGQNNRGGGQKPNSNPRAQNDRPRQDGQGPDRPQNGQPRQGGQNQNRPQNGRTRQAGQNQDHPQNGRTGQNQDRPQGGQRSGRVPTQRSPRPAEEVVGESKRPAGQKRRPQPMVRGDGIKKPRKPLNRSGENNFDYFKPPPIKTSAGIKARSQEGQYALSWWAARWIAAMENLVDGRRLGRGRSYAKDGQVLSIEEKPGGVIAQVQGSRIKPYRVAIEVIPLADFEWEKVFDVLASQALFAAQLLAGEMPRNIEEAFDAAGTSLFPARLGDLHTDCSCPDWANPCKHVAATHYILADRFDEDPFLLFRLRGRTSEQILAELRERRSGSGEEPLLEEPPVEEIQPAAPLPGNVDRFYRLGKDLDDFALSFKAPAIEMAVLKRLGDPNFLGQESLLATLEPVYQAVRSAALEAALGEAGGEEEDANNGKS